MVLFLAYQQNNIYLRSAWSLFAVINAVFTLRKNESSFYDDEKGESYGCPQAKLSIFFFHFHCWQIESYGLNVV